MRWRTRDRGEYYRRSEASARVNGRSLALPFGMPPADVVRWAEREMKKIYEGA